MQLSSTQREVLEHMARGHKLYASIDSPPWLYSMPGKGGLNKRIRSSTFWVLLQRNFIERVDTEKTPWWRRDYTISNAGIAALEEAQNDAEAEG